METGSDAGGPGGPAGLETFLRGMETKGKDAREPPRPALKPSLEGWKPGEAGGGWIGPRYLETFLRGMETGDPVDGRRMQLFLETFLRGMETWGTPPDTRRHPYP